MTAGAWTKVNNADNAEAVYYQANTICFYRLGALWCASQMGGTPLTARLIGIMLKPLEVINMASTSPAHRCSLSCQTES